MSVRQPPNRIQSPSLPPGAYIQHLFAEYQQKFGLKRTQQRDIIVSCFCQTHEHISVDELLAKAKSIHQKIGYATVYRTLKLLVHAGLAEERQFGDGQTRYEVAGPDTPHHDHLICTKCHLILEFENQDIENLQNKIALRLGGFTLTHHKMELYGLCPKARGEMGGDCPNEKPDKIRL